MGGEQYYHRRRRQRQRKQARQARQREQTEQARQRESAAATNATTNADTSSSSKSSYNLSSNKSNHARPRNHHTNTNHDDNHRHDHNMIDESNAMPMSKGAGVESSSAKTASSATGSINPSTVVHCAGQELHFIRSRTALSPGQKCFTMTSTQQLIPCTISSSTTYECKKGKKAIKYEIILHKHRTIQNNVDHSRLRILHHKPSRYTDTNTYPRRQPTNSRQL